MVGLTNCAGKSFKHTILSFQFRFSTKQCHTKICFACAFRIIINWCEYLLLQFRECVFDHSMLHGFCFQSFLQFFLLIWCGINQPKWPVCMLRYHLEVCGGNTKISWLYVLNQCWLMFTCEKFCEIEIKHIDFYQEVAFKMLSTQFHSHCAGLNVCRLHVGVYFDNLNRHTIYV